MPQILFLSIDSELAIILEKEAFKLSRSQIRSRTMNEYLEEEFAID